MTIYTIYKATNKINNKIYIGFTSKSLEYRRYRHTKKVTNKCEHIFHKAIKKYGKESFDWTILYQSNDSKHNLNIMEPYYIKEYNSHYIDGHGYNMTYGGEGSLGRIPWNKGINHKENPQSKEYILISPQNEKFIIKGLQSVTDYGLKINSMRNSLLNNKPISMGKRKGWQLFLKEN